MKLITIAHFFHAKKLYLLPIGVFALLFVLSLQKREITIYPGVGAENIIAFDDHETKGNSRLEAFQVENAGVTIQYTLQGALSYPYTGFIIKVKNGSRFKNLSSYDHFLMDLVLKKQQNVTIYLHCNVPGFTKPDNLNSYRFLYKSLTCLHPEEHFEVPVKTFVTPSWWYYNNKLPDNSFGSESFKEVAQIIIQSGDNDPINQSFNFTLKKISFRKDIKKRALFTVGAALCWLLLYSFLYLIYNNRKNQSKESNDKNKVVISYEPLVVSNDSDDSLQRIVSYIAKEYKNPELTVTQIASEVGVSPASVTQILRDKKNCSYKQYLNAIRLTEAKRLLLETDRNVVDISLKVGYNNVTHFNRIFKEIEGVSPRQFRSTKDEGE